MMDIFSIGFWIVSTMVVASSLGVVVSRNPLVSALYLALSFILSSVLFIMLEAHFIALVQIIIYAGAVVVLFIYVIMLLDLSPKNFKGTYGLLTTLLSLVLGAGIIFILIFGFVGIEGVAFTPLVGGYSSIEGLARALFTEYVIPFELVSLVLMIGIIGAVMLLKKIPREREEK